MNDTVTCVDCDQPADRERPVAMCGPASVYGHGEDAWFYVELVCRDHETEA